MVAGAKISCGRFEYSRVRNKRGGRSRASSRSALVPVLMFRCAEVLLLINDEEILHGCKKPSRIFEYLVGEIFWDVLTFFFFFSTVFIFMHVESYLLFYAKIV